ncbi:hypothetical protein [Streptomyces sp. NPDC050560]|uniref:hypothetical protein n=1 Tax=Streptomyces sp. NPDC050560 TaxID=3365630 RepID=UPI0037A24363
MAVGRGRGAYRKGRAGRGGWSPRRAPLWLRALLLLCCVAGAVPLWQQASHAYDDAMAYRRAPVCAGRAARDCVELDTGVVRALDKYETCTTDSNGVRTCTWHYRLRVERPHRTQWIGVGSRTYRDTHRGDAVDLHLWRGSVVRMVVAGHTETYRPPSEESTGWWAAGLWLVLGAALWAACGGRLAMLFNIGTFGWLWLSVPVVLFVRAALFGAGAVELVVAAVMALFGVVFTVFAWAGS